MGEVVIITGSSAGIGYDLSKYLINKGYTVYGLSRSETKLKGLNHIKCDVTNEKLVNEVINNIYNTEGKIDILINNAGMGISGSIEATKLEDVNYIYNVNVIAPFLTVKAVLPIMRKQKSGKIVNIGSVASEFPIPFQSFYSATKASLKAFTESLHTEVSPYGIKVSTILPGDIKTNFTTNRNKNKDELDVYNKRVLKSLSVMEKDEQNGYDVSYASKVIYKVINKRKMPLTKVIGPKYSFMIFIKRLLPIKFVTNIVGKIYGFKKLK